MWFANSACSFGKFCANTMSFFAITLPEAQPITKSLQLGSLPRVQCTYTRSSLTVEQSTLKQLELFIHFVV